MIVTLRFICLLYNAQADKLEEESSVEGDTKPREEEVEDQISILFLL